MQTGEHTDCSMKIVDGLKQGHPKVLLKALDAAASLLLASVLSLTHLTPLLETRGQPRTICVITYRCYRESSLGMTV